MRDRMETMERITSADDDWQDLREGETALVLGRISGVAFNDEQITVSFADWTDLLIDTPGKGAASLFTRTESAWRQPGAPKSARIIRSDEQVVVHVRRVEEGVGLQGIACWKHGGVPIPLVAA